MPHKVGKKWKWGNIERSSKEDLRKTVYGIWMKNGSKGSFSKFWKTGKVNEDETTASAKKIDFPADEIDSLKDRLSVVTTRVSDDFSKFELGDNVIAPWGKTYRVTSRIEINDINDHPYYDELTQDQVEFLSDYDKIAVLQLDEIQYLSKMVFRKVPRNELVSLLDEIETYNENKRFKREQFEKYLGSDKMIDREDKSMYYGLFSLDGHCLALSYLNKTPADCVLVAQISCVVPSYGRLLLQDIIDRSSAMWLAKDPTAEDTLLDYYRTFGLEEVVLDHSKWADGKEEHFFLKASGKSREKILDTIESAKAL